MTTKVASSLIKDATSAGLALLRAADAAAQRAALGVSDIGPVVRIAFTPAYGGSTGNGTLSYDVQEGWYWDVGGRRYFECSLRTSAVTAAPSGDLRIIGLPAGAAAASPSGFPVTIATWEQITLPASRVQLGGYVQSGDNHIRLFGCASGVARSLVQGSGLAINALMILSGSYQLA